MFIALLRFKEERAVFGRLPWQPQGNPMVLGYNAERVHGGREVCPFEVRHELQ